MTTKTKTYIKKIIVEHEASSAKARAARLKKLRNLANLSRQEICANSILNFNTYKGWEIARYGGLPQDGALKVIHRIAIFGVICTLDWLLHGKGDAPYLTTYLSAQNNQHAPLLPKDIVLREYHLYQSYNSQACLLEILDDGITPQYNAGDFVAGIKQTENLHLFLNKICIVKIKNGPMLLRYLKEDISLNGYRLMCTNQDSTVEPFIIYNAKIEFVALVARHYLLNS